MKTTDEFLQQLERQARRQAVLHEKRLLPRQLDSLTVLIGNYPWQILSVLSFLAALLIRLFK